MYTEPSNVITNQTSTIERKLFKPCQHKADPYERAEEFAKQDKDIWRKKVIHENMFKSMSHGNKAFTKDKEQYGIDAQAEQIMKQKKGSHQVRGESVNQDARFKLARRGHGDPIARYPEWAEPRVRAQTEVSELVKSSKVKGDRETWKPPRVPLSRPSPSVSLMARNMRRRM